MMTTTAVAGAADTLVIPVGTMTMDGVAGADIAGIATETTTAVVVETGADTNGRVGATTVVSRATAPVIGDTSGTIPTDMDIGSLYLTAT
jgi:hypothetical protein